MGHSKPGTIGKLGRLTRRVKRNIERAQKARGKREKGMVQSAFEKGFQLGADMMKARITNATAGMEYEPAPEVVAHSNVDIESDGPLATDPGDTYKDTEHLNLNTIFACQSPESYGRETADQVSHF